MEQKAQEGLTAKSKKPKKDLQRQELMIRRRHMCGREGKGGTEGEEVEGDGEEQEAGKKEDGKGRQL